jgi:pimeloyl-ACP methyl ester carboxylesterase
MDPETGAALRLPVAEGVALAADAWGDPGDPPVVLLHGGGQTRHAWAGTAQSLAREGWYAVCVDQRGHGESDWSPDGRYGFEIFAEDAARLVQHFARPPILVGASLGGIASLLAIAQSTRPLASALVLVDIAPRMERAGAERIIAFMRAHPEGFADPEEAADAIAAYLPHRPRRADASGLLAKNLRRGPDGRYRWHWDPRFMEPGRGPSVDRDTPHLEDAARGIRIPTLLVRGRMSDLLSEEGAQHVLALVPHARYVDVSGAGHMVAGDRNDAFTSAVLAFLAEDVRPVLRGDPRRST